MTQQHVAVTVKGADAANRVVMPSNGLVNTDVKCITPSWQMRELAASDWEYVVVGTTVDWCKFANMLTHDVVVQNLISVSTHMVMGAN